MQTTSNQTADASQAPAASATTAAATTPAGATATGDQSILISALANIAADAQDAFEAYRASVLASNLAGAPLTTLAAAATAASATTTPPLPGQPWPAQGGTYIGIAPAEGTLPMRHLVALDIAPGDDATTERNWADACAWAIAQGNGARLPTQLEALFAYTTSKAAFAKDLYWTGTQGGRTCAFYQSFAYGNSYWRGKDYELRCRAFRGFDLHTFTPLPL